MTAAGYETAKQIGEQAARVVAEIATLIGKPGTGDILLSNGTVIQPGLGLSDDAAALAARAADLERGLFTLLVIGEFKNGKSTLLNAMIGSKTLPAKAAPATAIITVLSRGVGPQVKVYEEGRKEPRLLGREEFLREFQLSPSDQETLDQHGPLDRFANVEYAEMECGHAICDQGVKLIDSPGLGEHVSRSRVSTNFLKRSQAVVLVLNATRILTRDERAFVESVLVPGKLNHVFFVVNRVNQVDPEAIPEIEAWVEAQLAPHFQGPAGFDRAFYERRVFFVDAKTALDLRSASSSSGDIEATGVPALEAELERFLTGEERIASALQSTAHIAEAVLARAEQRIKAAIGTLDAPLAELELRREQAERRLQQLESRREEIERLILLFGDAVKQKVYADLRRYIEDMRAAWDEDSHRYMDLDRVLTPSMIVKAYADKGARERVAADIAEELKHYLEAKFTAWSERIPTVVERDVAALAAEVEAQVGDLEAELDQIAATFGGVQRAVEGRSNPGLIQVVVSEREIAGITEKAMGMGDLGRLVGGLVQQILLVRLVASLVTGSLFLATVIMQAIRFGTHEGELKKRVRETLGQRLFENLQAQVAEKREFVYSAIQNRFQDFASDAGSAIAKQVAAARDDQMRIVHQRRDQTFSRDAERRRLELIAAELERLRGEIIHLAANPTTSSS